MEYEALKASINLTKILNSISLKEFKMTWKLKPSNLNTLIYWKNVKKKEFNNNYLLCYIIRPNKTHRSSQILSFWEDDIRVH